MNETWAATAHYLSRYRGALLGGVGSAVAVAMTADPSTGLAASSLRFAVWFALVATPLAVCLTVVLSLAQSRAVRPWLPKAILRRRS